MGGEFTRVLIDTNILIYREDPKVLSTNLRELFRIIRENGHLIMVHPASENDIENDSNLERKKIIISKLKSYPILKSPPNPDKNFLNSIDSSFQSHLDPDNMMLYAIYKDAADILITEDRGIIRKASKIEIEDRVMDINSAMNFFGELYKHEFFHVMLKEEHLYNINVEDPIFNNLKEEYEEFEDWFRKKSREGRKCWVYEEENNIKAILIYKIENEPVNANPPLPKKRRFKISTLTVELTGYKIGELFLKLAIYACVDNKIDEIYLTHFTKKEDYLVDLIIDFGFESYGENRRGETVYLKKLYPENEENIDPMEMSKKFFPSFKDGESICKFIIPIRPEFHDRLFQDYSKRQMKLPEYTKFNLQGNTIKKAYFSHSKIKKIRKGDIILFYRSRDQHTITSLGVVEDVHVGLTDEDKVLRVVGKRSVYTFDEIKKLIKKPITVIIFRHHFYFQNTVHLSQLTENGILQSAPQSITEISNEGYQYIKKKGGINEYFTFD